MGYLACPVCERESLADVSDLQQRVAAALNRPLSCPICSASVSGIQAFHHHLAAHLPAQHKSYPDASPSTPATPSSIGFPSYPITGSPEGIPTLEHLEINDSRGSPRSPSGHSMIGKEGMAEISIGLITQGEPQCPSPILNLSSPDKVTQPHNCDLCGLIFSSEYFLKFHKDIVHSKREIFDVTCKLCKEKFKDFEAYRNHVRENHSDRRYICDQCPKTFKMKGSLLVHMRMFHDPTSPGTCHLCKKTFTTKARKELHEKRYHGVGLEHVPTGNISPPSPSQKQQKTKNSSLGDAKSWLETLMIETRPAGEDGNRYRELQDQQNQQPMPNLPQQTTASYSSQQTQSQHSQMNPSEDQLGNQFVNNIPHQQHQTEQKKDKGTRDIQTQLSQELQHLQKSQLSEPDHQQLQKWTSEFQPYLNTSEKVTLPKTSPDMYYQQQKVCISLPGHLPQQTHGQNRSRTDYSDFKQDKKFPVLPHGGDSSGCRPVGASYTQQSPVAIVSPQPQKSETPPAETQSNGGAPCHTEVRRNSFPLMNVNKLGMSQTETPHLHPSSYISELSLTASAAIPIPSSQNMHITHLGDKIQNTLAVSQQLVYQHSQSIIPTLNPNMTLIGPDTKIGVKVPPLLIPSSQLVSVEKMKEPPDSPIQMMQVQDESCASEMMSESDLVTESKMVPDIPQDHRPDAGQTRRQGATGILTTVPPATIIRKESTGKMDSKQWECEVCKKSFTTKYFLKKHKRLHTGETPYACAECGKTFTFQQSYHKHILYHSDDKPHQCSYCGRAFKEMSTLHNHVRIHTGEKPFVCENCGKAFRQRVSYLVHQRIHTGVMPYTCEACGRSFRYKVSLRSHKCEPTVVSPPVAVASMPNRSIIDGIGEVRGESGTSASSSTPPSATPIILLPQPSGTTAAASTVVGMVTTGGGSRKKEDMGMGDSQTQQMTTSCSSSSSSSSSSSASNNEASSYLNINRQHRLKIHQQQRLPHQQQHQPDITKHQQEVNDSVPGRIKGALETIDLSAISCDGQPDGKKSPNKSNRSPSQCVSPRSAGMTGVPGYNDPISVAFLHALVDPQQGRLQGECRPHPQLPPQDGLPFPSLSPGAMDTDLDHDNFLTNLLM